MKTREQEKTMQSVEVQLVELLHEQGLTITTAESCTGGLISARLVNVSGASEVLKLCVVTYSEEAKQKILGVREETIKEYGVVSEEVAYEMAEGALRYADADVALSVTGVAGPGGGTTQTPVGTVFIGCSVKGNTVVEKHLFQGDRLQIRECCVDEALRLARRIVDISYVMLTGEI